MKKLINFALLLGLAGIAFKNEGTALGQAPNNLTVSVLDHGACWLGLDNLGGENRWGIASFGDGKSFQLSKRIINVSYNSKIERALRSAGLEKYPQTEYELWLNCTSVGAYLSLNFMEGNPSLCIRIDHQGSHEIKISLFSNNISTPGFCYGEKPLTIIMYSGLDIDPSGIKNYLLDSYPEAIEAVSYRSLNALGFIQYMVTVTKDFEFSQKRVVERLKADENLSAKVTDIGYDNVLGLAGEKRKILDHIFPGY